MQKLFFILLAFSFMGKSVLAEQIQIYTTFENYENGSPTTLDGDVDGFPDFQNNVVYQSGINVKTSEKKHTFRARDIWGFKYKGVLFRSMQFTLKQQRNNLPSYGFMALASQGNICYWENGIAILDVLNSSKNPRKGYIYGLSCNGIYALSKSIDSDIHSGRFYKFFQSYPEYKAIPADFKSSLTGSGCTKSKFVSKVNLTSMNKLYDLGGTDDIAFMNFWAGVNDNFGKTMGLSAKIYIPVLDAEVVQCIRDYFKKYNNGNFEQLIAGSVLY